MASKADFESSLQKKMEDPEFMAEYDALEPEYEILKLLPEAESMYTARQLSKITGLSARNFAD
ncbi:MAG: hypothetical protein LUD47_04775 [Clostridia bacterium]|nr:hypothetical protein [Clostridia bacterium]